MVRGEGDWVTKRCRDEDRPQEKRRKSLEGKNEERGAKSGQV